MGVVHLIVHVLPIVSAGTVGFPVLLDGYNPTYVPRKTISGATVEILYRVNVTPEGLRQNGTHAFIPLRKMIQASYARDMPPLNSYEAGISKWMFFKNPVSLFGNRVVAGLAEKMHTFSYNGSFRTDGLDKASVEISARSANVAAMAKAKSLTRNTLVAAFALLSRLGTQLVNAGHDHNHMDDLVRFARSWDGAAGIHRTEPKAIGLRAKMMGLKSWLNKADYGPLKSDNNCLHFEDTPGLELLDDWLVLPLNRNIVSHRGHTSFAPSRRVGIMAGVSSLRYIQDDDVLEIHVHGSSLFHIDFASAPEVPPTFFVGPVDGRDWPVSDEGRADPATPSLQAFEAYQKINQLPLDYEALFLPPDEICSESMADELSTHFADFDMANIIKGHVSAEDGKKIAITLARAVSCGTDYLKSAVSTWSHGFDLLECLVWGHYIFETPTSETMALIHVKGWNAIRTEYAGEEDGGIKSPLDYFDTEDLFRFLGFLSWITCITVGFASEFTLGPLLVRMGASLEFWKYAQLFFPLLATVTLQLAAQRNPLCMLTLVLGLWKFGFPETFYYVRRGFKRKQGYLIACIDSLDGWGLVFHHSAAAMGIAQLNAGTVALDRHICAASFPLIVQHWFALLRYKSVAAYTIMVLIVEAWFEWEVISNFKYLDEKWEIGATTVVMLTAHWMVILSSLLRLILKLCTTKEVEQSGSTAVTRNTIQLMEGEIGGPGDFEELMGVPSQTGVNQKIAMPSPRTEILQLMSSMGYVMSYSSDSGVDPYKSAQQQAFAKHDLESSGSVVLGTLPTQYSSPAAPQNICSSSPTIPNAECHTPRGPDLDGPHSPCGDAKMTVLDQSVEVILV
jgi:hypothetical protein